MKDKRIIKLVLGLVLLSTYLIGQNTSEPNSFPNLYDINTNYNNYTDHMNSYYENNPDEIGSRGYKQFERMKGFWFNRVGKNGETPSLKHLENAALELFYTNPSCISSSTVSPNWRFLGPDNSTQQDLGIIQSIKIDPNDASLNTVYAGSNASGLWKTTNAMANEPVWFNITDNTGLPGLGVQTIVVDPNNSNRIFIGTGVSTYYRAYGVGILKTEDGGLTWDISYFSEPNDIEMIKTIIMDPSDSDVLYAAVNNRLLRTMDGGNTWQEIYENVTTYVDDDGVTQETRAHYIWDLEFDLSNTNFTTIYGTTNATHALWGVQYQDTEFFRIDNTKSSNPNENSNITQPFSILGQGVSIAVTPANVNRLYLIDSENRELMISENGGISWDNAYGSNTGPFIVGGVISGTIGQACNYLSVSSDSEELIYIGGTRPLSVDISGNNNFGAMDNDYWASDGVHADIRAIDLVSVNNIDNIFLATDGGISYSSDGGASFENINGKGLQLSQFYKMDSPDRFSNFLIGGLQDNGSKINNNGIWEAVGGGDGSACLVEDKNPENYLYMINPFLSGTANHGDLRIGPSTGSTLIYKTPKNETVFSAARQVRRYSKSSNTWVNITGNLPLGNDKLYRAIDVSKSNPDVMYIGRDHEFRKESGDYIEEGELFKSTNGGDTWVDISENWPANRWSNNVSSIAIDPFEENKLYLGVGGFWGDHDNWWSGGDNRVLLSTNGGSSYLDFSDGLSTFPINDLVYQEGANVLYAATDIGVYFRELDENNSIWEQYCDNLPPCIVTDLKIDYCSQKLRAATFGRSIWEADLIPLKTNQYLSIVEDLVWDERQINTNLKIKNNSKLEIKGEAWVSNPEYNVIIENGSELKYSNVSFKYCQCPKSIYKVYGDLNVIGNFSVLENSKINIYSGGEVRINGDFCLKTGTKINIYGTGKLYINGKNRTNDFKNIYQNKYNLSLSNQIIYGNKGAFNQITVHNNVSTSSNPSSLLAGRSILIKKNFVSKKNFLAKIDQDFNNCNTLSCTDEETFPIYNFSSPFVTSKLITLENETSFESKEYINEENKIDIVVFPNPTKGVFTVKINDIINIESSYSIKIFNSIGKLVCLKEIDNSLEVKIENLIDKGLYYVVILENGKELVAEAVIIK